MAQCLTPMDIRNKTTNEPCRVPCGKCANCLARRASAWSFRLMQQEKVSTSAHFITLTYDTMYVPITDRRFMSLSRRHLQLFFKRLRKAHEKFGGLPLKYFAVGEYGGRFKRPHYHVILFNARLPLIEPAWGQGHVHYGDVTGASIGYTLKYISKKGMIPMFQGDDRVPEFALMSKNLGLNYLTQAMIAWHKNDLTNRMYCNLLDGKKISMPRYYKDKLYNEAERAAIKEVATWKLFEANAKVQMEAEAKPLYYRNKREAIAASFRKLESKKLEDGKI